MRFGLNRPAVLDANLLAESTVSDLYLRIAESTDAYSPVWTETILEETLRTFTGKLGWPESMAVSRLNALRAAFPDAKVIGFESHIADCTNDPKDRHILAAAIQAEAKTIVTLNIKHFRPDDLAPWGVTACHPADFLIEVLDSHRSDIDRILEEMSKSRNRTMVELLSRLSATIPKFADRMAELKGISYPPYKPKRP